MRAAISSVRDIQRGPRTMVTGPWVAPEILREGPFTNKADVWALAVSWTYAFRVDYTPQGPATLDDDSLKSVEVKQESENEILLEFAKQLRAKGRITQPFCDLLLSMLSWDPSARPSVAEALCHNAWQELWVRKGLERQDRMKMPSDGPKRVRILSPEESEGRGYCLAQIQDRAIHDSASPAVSGTRAAASPGGPR